MKIFAAFFLGLSIAAGAQTCAPTPAAAARAYLDGVRGESAEGYRVVALRRDALQQRVWAMVERCGEPAAPWLAVQFERGTERLAAARPVVRAGEEVVVRAHSAASTMELHGWAEESGALQQKVRVRLPRISEDSGEAAPRIVCVVTGAGYAEVWQ